MTNRGPTVFARTPAAMFSSRRIADRIFLGYLLPLLFFLAAALVLPYLLTDLLGQAVRDYAGTVRFVDDAYALRRSAVDSENQLRGFLLYGDAGFRSQFSTSRDEYRQRFRNMEDFIGQQKDNTLAGYMGVTDAAYKRWLQTKATPEFAAADRALFRPRNAAVAQAAAVRSARSFDNVRSTLDKLVDAATQYREQQLRRAQTSELWRNIFTFATPVAAIGLAILFARFFTQGITGPIEELRVAAEEAERGDTTFLLLDDTAHGEDEIGDLGRALSRMARTIGEREAILKAQNEALTAIGRRIEAVLNATNDGIVLIDRAEGFSLVNVRFATLFGLNTEDVLDQTFADAGALFLDRFKHKGEATAKFREWVADPAAVAEETMDVLEPAPRTLRIYTAPVRGETSDENGDASPGIIGRIFVFRDVTRETIVDRMKTEFVSTVSHELRTPLTAIKGYVDLMISGKTGPLNGVQSEFLTMVQASTRRLTDLINDMLDISRIESGRMTVRRETVQYLPLVREAMRMMANQAEARRVSLLWNISESVEKTLPPVRGDGDRITQVLVNLLSNGIKYTPGGGTIAVSVEVEGDVVTTCIADNGIGINVEDQNRLFQKFFRADNSTTREVGGTGLGLAITKAILERLHGTIRVESEVGNGTRFYFTLPVAGSPEKNGEQSRASSVPAAMTGTQPLIGGMAQRGLILIADEDPAILHRINGLFRGRGFVTSGALNFAEAIRRARDLHPDAMILNLCATRLNVLGVLHRLRSHDDTRATVLFPVALRHNANVIEPQPRLSIVPNDAPVPPDAIVLTGTDTAASLEALLPEESSETARVFVDLADFPEGDSRAESLALALQRRLIRGKGIILLVRDLAVAADGVGAFQSLTPPDSEGTISLETIAEQVGNRLRQEETKDVRSDAPAFPVESATPSATA